ncbi:uridine kinase [Clostridia bacterium]|nr:uridine kinase [Clostridia bacterium]
MSKPYVIGVAGGSAGGKSTFADALEKKLDGIKTYVIHMDSYFKEKDQRPYSEAPVTGAMYIDDNHPLTMDLPKLAIDLTAAIDGGEYEIIIVEGLLTLWDKNIYEKLDLKLFVDCRADERIVRRLKRNMTWGLTFDQISGVYLDLVRYRHDEYVEPSKWRADLILNGSKQSDTALDMVVSYVRQVQNEKA